MSVTDIAERSEIIKKYRVHERDTGSPEVQIALLTQRLGNLSKHFEKHSQDLHSQRGLMQMVSKRKRLLAYLRRENVNRYKEVIDKLGLRK